MLPHKDIAPLSGASHDHPPLSLALAHRVTCHYAVKKRPRKYLDATELSGEGSTVFTDLLLLYPSHKSSCQQIFQAPV